MKGRCEELGGTWIAKDYSLNPYTCEMGGKNYAVVNNPKMYMIHLWLKNILPIKLLHCVQNKTSHNLLLDIHIQTVNSKLQFNILDNMATPYPKFSLEYNS